MTTGVVRRLDELGRIVIPKEIRKTLKIREGESLEISADGERVILRKHSHLADVKAVIDSILYALTKTTNIDFFLIEKDKIVKTSKLFKDFENHQITESIKSGVHSSLKLSKSLELNISCIVKNISMHGDIIGHLIFINEDLESNKEQIEFLMTFLKDYIEK